ncbi:cell surface glycoprotein MUC18 [Xenentodon cancila]
MKTLVVAALVVLIHGSYESLIIKGPTQPVLEGDMVTLECLYSDTDLNISQVHFEYFSQYMDTWRTVFSRSFSSRYDWGYCFSERMMVEESDDKKLLLNIYYTSRFSGVPFRCVSDADNVTEPDNSSQPLTFKVHYLREPSISVEGYSAYLSAPREMKVRLGDDVSVKCSASSSEEPSYFWQKEGSDWILPSSSLTLKKTSVLDEGQYTCLAKNPSVESLSKTRTISIKLLPEDAPWYETTNGRLWLMISAAAMALFVFILSVSVFLCRRAKQIKTSKGPIDDRSQKKPIYKTSVESLPSTCGDKQPLV